MGSLLPCIEGCTYVRDVKQDDPFRLLYNAERKEVRGEEAKTPEVYLTLSAFQMPLSLFCRILSDKYDIGMVFSHELSERQITAEFKKTDLQSVKRIEQQQNIALFSADAGKTSMQIWAKLYRVSTPVSEAYPRADRFSAAPAGAPENEPLRISMKNEQ